jgi:uncharacterized protein YneF (UPF0154 family)
MKSRLLLVLPFALLCAGPAFGRDKQEFPVQWKVGTAYIQDMVMAQEMTLPGGQGEMQTEMTMKISAAPKKGSKEGTTEVTMTYDSADMTMKMGGNDVPGGGEALKALVGKSITSVFDAEGAVVDIKDMEKLIGDDPMLARMLNKDSMKQMVSQASLMAQPDRPVSPGDSWTFSIEYPMPMMKMAMKGKYTYEKDEKINGAECARLVLDGQLTMEADAGDEKKEGEDPQAAQQRELLKSMGFKVSESSIKGVMHYDFAMANVSKTEMDMSLTMSMKDPTTQQPMTMPMKTKVSNTLKAKNGK